MLLASHMFDDRKGTGNLGRITCCGARGESQQQFPDEAPKFDNGSGKKTGQASAEVIQGETSIRVPMGPGLRGQNLFLMAVIRSLNDDFPQWKQKVSLYLLPAGSGYQIVGVEKRIPRRTHRNALTQKSGVIRSRAVRRDSL